MLCRTFGASEFTPVSIDGVKKRDEVGKLAVSDIGRALEIARSIREPWYRSQSLAHVAWRLNDAAQTRKVIGESLSAAYEEHQPYRIVTVASWVVRVMVKTGDKRLGNTVHELLSKIQREPNPVCRGDALLHVFEAVYYEPQQREVVLDALLRACEQMNSWKRPRILSFVALAFAKDEPERTAEILKILGEGPTSRRTRRDIAAGTWLGPYEFFPYFAKLS